MMRSAVASVLTGVMLILGAAAQTPPAEAAAVQTAAAAAVQAQTTAPPPVTAAGWVVYDPHDDVVLAGAEADVGRHMASTTKIMTALLALEAGTIGDTVTVSPTAAAADDVSGAATLGLAAGQRIPMRHLLPALLLRSGNDAAAAVAEHVAGTEADFVARMNTRAAELGLTRTHFVDASGLTDDERHRASPRDLAVLAVRALENPDFAEWSASVSLELPAFGTLHNRNELLGSYPGATGVKTGFTNLAGLCLVASATRDGRDVVVVVLGSAVDDARAQHFRDSAALLDHGFASWRRAEPVTTGSEATVYRWAGTAVPLMPVETLGHTVPSDATVTWRTALPPTLDRPLTAGAEAGVAELLVDGAVVGSTPLITGAPVPAPDIAAMPPAAAAGSAVQEALRGLVHAQPFDRAA